jgi:hypothetical protein
MAEVLGRVVVSDLASPRGPDAFHRIRVPRAWLERGATIELELPRHLTCAACSGGGCDVCHRSGAVTLHGRDEPTDLVEVSLPEGPRDDAFVIRIPERGGLAPPEALLPRGHLLLRVEPSAADDATASAAIGGQRVELVQKAESTKRVRVPARGVQPRAIGVAVLVLAIVVVIWLLSR